MAHGTRPHGITRRDLLPVLGAAGIAAIAPQALAVSAGRRSSAVARTVYVGSNTTAEIRVHPSGRFLYNTNRGHNSVAEFAIDHETGKLESIGWESSGGQWPRGMNLDPSGTFLYVANQNTDTIVVFHVGHNGKLHRSGAVVNAPTPVDVAFGAPI